MQGDAQVADGQPREFSPDLDFLYSVTVITKYRDFVKYTECLD